MKRLLLLLLLVTGAAHADDFADAKLLVVQKTWSSSWPVGVGVYSHWLVTVQLGDQRITGLTRAASDENLYIALHEKALAWGTPIEVRLVRNRMDVRLADGTLMKMHVEFSKKVAP